MSSADDHFTKSILIQVANLLFSSYHKFITKIEKTDMPQRNIVFEATTNVSVEKSISGLQSCLVSAPS